MRTDETCEEDSIGVDFESFDILVKSDVQRHPHLRPFAKIAQFSRAFSGLQCGALVHINIHHPAVRRAPSAPQRWV